MKIPELRELLERTSLEDLKRAVVEIYRAVPKKMRQQLAIDDLLKNPAVASVCARPAKARAQTTDIDALEAELEQFLSDAYAQHYYVPNRFVPKSERPKWRFKVKHFFRDINAAVASSADIEKASGMLERLYAMLCYACDFVLFSAYDPFESVGIDQADFLDAVLALKAQHLSLDEFVDHGLRLVRDSSLNRYTLGSDLARVLVERLPTPDSTELAVEHAAELYTQICPASGKKLEYKDKDKLNRLAEAGFLACAKLSEYDRAIEFLKTRYASDPEIVLSVLLRWLRGMKRKDLWTREYERAIRSGITPRDVVRDAYRHLKEHGEFPALY